MSFESQYATLLVTNSNLRPISHCLTRIRDRQND